MKLIPKVSIITPVYNAQKYLYRCLDSIKKQSFTDWECILIDDGSTDQSGRICDEYASNDSRFKVIHKNNSGVAMSRQIGVDAAKGLYSIHVDPDDYIDVSMLMDMYAEIVRQGADILVCDYYLQYESGKTKEVKQSLKGDDVISLVEQTLFHTLHGCLWNKMIRHSCYKEYNVRFYPNINNREDVLVWAQLSKSTLHVGYHSRSYYYYCLNDNSITSNKTYGIDKYHALKEYIEKLYEFDCISSEAKLSEVHDVKLRALRQGLMTRREYYSFYPPNLMVALQSPSIGEKVFSVFAFFKMYYIGLLFYHYCFFVVKCLVYLKKRV